MVARMKAWRFHKFGAVENLRLEKAPLPEPGPGEALVRVQYAALNPADRYLIQGQYPRAGHPPLIVGRDGAGVVEAGSDLGLVRRGEPVLLLRSEVGVQRGGTLAQFTAVPEEALAPLPEGWTIQEGAAAPLVFLTAWQALVTEADIQPKQTVLITGASGGVGTAALTLAKALGARVVALSRSAEKRSRLRRLGADLVFDSEIPDLVSVVREALGGRRVDVAVDNLGGPYLQKAIHLTGFMGRVCVVGLLAGLKSEIEIASLMFKRIRIIGISMGGQTPGQSQLAWERIVETLDRTGARPVIDSVHPFDQVPRAFERLAQGPMGKVLVGPIPED